MTEAERKQAIKFQDAVGVVVDQFIHDGMSAYLMKEVLIDEADHVAVRKNNLEHGI